MTDETYRDDFAAANAELEAAKADAEAAGIITPARAEAERATWLRVGPEILRDIGITDANDPDLPLLHEEHQKLVQGTATAAEWTAALYKAKENAIERKAKESAVNWLDPTKTPEELDAIKKRAQERNQQSDGRTKQMRVSAEQRYSDELKEIAQSFGGTLAHASAEDFQRFEKARKDPVFRAGMLRGIRKDR